MSRTISNILKKRLQIQSSEAKTLGLVKVSERVDNLVNKTGERDPEQFYTYSHEELQEDVESLILEATLRVQDFYNKTGDIGKISEGIESIAGDLIDMVRNNIGGSVVGAYEPSIPGEIREHTTIEVSDE